VVVPLSATDPDIGDVVNFSVWMAPPPFASPGRLTFDPLNKNNLRITVPAGVRTPGYVSITLRATDTTTGESPLWSQQTIAVAIRPNFATPVTQMSTGDINVTGRRASITSQVGWTDRDAGCLAARACQVRWLWTYGDGKQESKTTPGGIGNVAHDFPGVGLYRGTVKATILWDGGEISTAPRAFNVTVLPDGRVVFKAAPKVTRRGVRRVVTVKVTATAAAPVKVTLSVKGMKKPLSANFKFLAPGTHTFTFRLSVKHLKTRRATIRVAPGPMTASGLAPTAFTRAIRL
jgi:hypothetical protein